MRHQLASAAGVIEVNMGEYQPVNLRGIERSFAKRLEQPRDRMVSAAIDEGAVSVMDDKVSSIKSWPHEPGVDGMNALGDHGLLVHQ